MLAYHVSKAPVRLLDRMIARLRSGSREPAPGLLQGIERRLAPLLCSADLLRGRTRWRFGRKRRVQIVEWSVGCARGRITPEPLQLLVCASIVRKRFFRVSPGGREQAKIERVRDLVEHEEDPLRAARPCRYAAPVLSRVGPVS
jgi:hypothetical protein